MSTLDLPVVGVTPDPDWASMLTVALSALNTDKAEVESPTFTGTPAAPTPPAGDNSTRVATTAYVMAAVGGGGGGAVTSVNGKTGVVVLAASDVGAATAAQGAKADTALQSVPATYALLASPVFTGDPKAPTPATGDNDTSIATTAFVKAQGYAPLASPALTGNPTAPTQTAGNNSTRLATTAFVTAAVAAGGGGGGGVPAPPSGTKIALIGAEGSSDAALQGGWLNMLPIYVPANISISAVTLEVTVAGTAPSTLIVGLYSVAAVGGSGTLVTTFGTADASTTGIKTLSGSWTITKGVYYLVFLPSANAPRCRAGGLRNGFAYVLPLASEAVAGKRYLSDSGSTSLPATSSASPSANGSSGSAAVAALSVVMA